jgi:hypothetical protein
MPMHCYAQLDCSPHSILGDDVTGLTEFLTSSPFIHGFATEDRSVKPGVACLQKNSGRSPAVVVSALGAQQWCQQHEQSDYSEVPEGSRMY